jgi:hypothetical protein
MTISLGLMLRSEGAVANVRRSDVSGGCTLRLIRAVSSAGRAPALQAGGRRFDPVTAHHKATISGRNPADHPSKTLRLPPLSSGTPSDQVVKRTDEGISYSAHGQV